MKTKTTHEIIDDQFKKTQEVHTKRTITLNQPRDDLLKYHQKEWVAVDDVIKWLELEVHRAGASYQMVEELKKSLSKSELLPKSKMAKIDDFTDEVEPL